MNYKKIWQKPPLCALPVVLILTACTASTPPASAPQQPLPAVLQTACPTPVNLPANNADAVFIALKQMYDLYGECAGKHIELIKAITKENL